MRSRRGFSMVELLVALTISAMLLTATLAALDTTFKGYKATTDTASTHVVTRLVMHRMMSLIRTGEDFGPYPANPLLNPTIVTNAIEFVATQNPDTETAQIWQIERVEVPGDSGPYHLVATIIHMEAGDITEATERVLLRNVREAVFTLDYDVGPRLRRATIDLTLDADDDQADAIMTDLRSPTVRLVGSVSPRRLRD